MAHIRYASDRRGFNCATSRNIIGIALMANNRGDVMPDNTSWITNEIPADPVLLEMVGRLAIHDLDSAFVSVCWGCRASPR